MIVEATGLEKSFGATVVLQGVDLEVREGSVLALLGPNGAGKTTIVRILTTLDQAGRGPGDRSPGTTSSTTPRRSVA